MEFVDTNYFLRYLLGDNEKQYQIAHDLFKAAISGKTLLFTSTVVFFEIYWVLSTFYKKNKGELWGVLSDVLKMNYIEMDERELLFEALEINKNYNLSLEDCYNLVYARKKGSLSFATFDKKLLKFYSVEKKREKD